MSCLKKICSAVAASDIDALLLLSPHVRQYACGFESSDGALLATADSAVFITDFRYFEAASAALPDIPVLMTDSENTYTSIISGELQKRNVHSLGFEEDWLTVSSFDRWCKALSVKFVPASRMISNIRVSKEPHEVENIKRAQKIAESALESVLPMIRPGATERAVAAELDHRMRLLGAERTSFDTIVVSGANGALPHGVPSDTVISEGCFVTMDFGCVYNGYCSDMTRTVAVSYATDEMKNVYDTVLKAQLAGIAAAKAGVACSAPDLAARSIIDRAGFEKCFGHSFGHGIGVEIHEAPRVSPANDAPLPEGAVISAEPGIYLPGKMGVRIEDMLYITSSGNENLTSFTKKLIILQ